MSAVGAGLKRLQGITFTLWTFRFSWTGWLKKKGFPMQDKPSIWHFFNEKDDPNIIGVEPEMISKADVARGKSGVPFIVTSGLRNLDENSRVNGSLKSAHLADKNGLAMGMDFSCRDDHELWSMLFGLYMAGFRRMGIYFTRCSDNPNKLIPRHIHADIMDDPSHPIEVIWCEMEQN